MILGVSLVVQELNKGPRLLFRYPEEGSSYYKRTFQLAVESGVPLCGTASRRYAPSTNVAIADSAEDEEDENNNNHSEKQPKRAARERMSLQGLQQSRAATRLNQINEQYFGLSDENFAKLFRAKNALLGKTLDVSIGDLRFVALPCTCPVTPTVAASPSLSPATVTPASTNTAAAAVTPTNGSEETKEKDTTASTSAERPLSTNKTLSVANQDSSSQNTSAVLSAANSSAMNSNNNNTSTTPNVSGAAVRDVISSFHIVIAMVSCEAMLEIQKDFLFRCQCRSPVLPGEDPIAAALGLRTKLTGVCSASIFRILEKASNILCEEEKKNRYLTREISQILQIIDSHRHDSQHTINSQHLTNLQEKEIDVERSFSTEIQDETNVTVVEFSRSRRSSSNTTFLSSKEREESGDISEKEKEKERESEKRSLSAAIPSTVSSLSSSVLASNPTRFLCHHILMESTLANELKTLFHSITDNHAVIVRFNGNSGKSSSSIVALTCKDVALCFDSQRLIATKGMLARVSAMPAPLVFRAPPLSVTHVDLSQTTNNPHSHYAQESSHAERENERGEAVSRVKSGVSLAHQTLLLLGDAEVIASALQTMDSSAHPSLSPSLSQHFSQQVLSPTLMGAQNSRMSSLCLSQRLHNLLEAADPTLSFLDLSLTLDEPIEELVSMAHYMQSWGLAEIVPTVCVDRCYQVHPLAPLSAESRVAKAFEALVRSLDVSVPLHSLSVATNNGGFAIPHRKRSASFTAPSPSPTISSSSLSLLANHATAVNTAHMMRRSVAEKEALRERESQGTHSAKERNVASSPATLRFISEKEKEKEKERERAKEKEKEKDPNKPKEKERFYHEIAIDGHRDVPPEYSLPRILSLFDGHRSLQDVVSLFPPALQECALHLVVLLLRWHMLLPVHTHLTNLFALSTCCREELCDPTHAVNYLSPYALIQRELDRERELQQKERERERGGRRSRRDSGDVGFALSDSERSLDIETLIARAQREQQQQQSLRKETPTHQEEIAKEAAPQTHTHNDSNNPQRKSNLTDNLLAKERESSFLQNVHCAELTAEEKVCLEKLAPWVESNEVSAKTLSEIMWSTKMSEREVNKVLQKLPYLHKVKKLL